MRNGRNCRREDNKDSSSRSGPVLETDCLPPCCDDSKEAAHVGIRGWEVHGLAELLCIDSAQAVLVKPQLQVGSAAT